MNTRFNSVGEYQEAIDELYEKEPDGRKKKEHKAWKDELNKLITEANFLAGSKIYNIVK